MQSDTSKIIIAVIITAVVVGGGVYHWQSSKQVTPNIQNVAVQPLVAQTSLKTYSSEKYSFNYPQGYSAQEGSGQANLYFPALTIKKADNKKLEIFQMKDFGDRPWGFSGDETQEDIDGYVPKEMLSVGAGDKKYDVWLYYSENDNQTKAELKAIFDSIKVI